MALWTGFPVQFWSRLLNLVETKVFFSKKSKWSHFLKKKKIKIPVLEQKGFPFAFNQFLAQWDIILEHMWFKDGHCGGHLGFQNRKIFTILNLLHLVLMPSIKFSSIWITVWEEMWFEDFTIITPKMLVTDIILGDYIGSATEATTCIDI